MRHMVFIYFLKTSSVWGKGGAARLSILFSFPCSVDHERDSPPCKIVFFGLATNTLNVRSNNNIYLGATYRCCCGTTIVSVRGVQVA